MGGKWRLELTVCWGFSAGILGRFLGRLLLIFRRWLCQPLGVYLSNWNRASLLPLFSYLYLFIYIYILLPFPPPGWAFLILFTFHFGGFWFFWNIFSSPFSVCMEVSGCKSLGFLSRLGCSCSLRYGHPSHHIINLNDNTHWIGVRSRVPGSPAPGVGAAGAADASVAVEPQLIYWKIINFFYWNFVENIVKKKLASINLGISTSRLVVWLKDDAGWQSSQQEFAFVVSTF